MRLNRIGYLFKEGLKSIFTHGFMSFASITIIVACLLIMGSFSLLALNIDSIIEGAEDKNEIVAFIDDSYDETMARAVEAQITSIANVSEVVFVSKEQAIDEYVQSMDDPDLFDDLEAEILRDRYIVYTNDIALMGDTCDNLKKIPGVSGIRADFEIQQGLITVRNVVTILSLIIVAILLVVSIFIMSNTIKLTTFGRRDEIAIMKMVGANNAFIRLPFVVEGLAIGLFGAALAFFIQWGIYEVVTEKVMESIAKSLIPVIPFVTMMYPVLFVFLGVGLLVGAFGGIIAIRNYLKV